jgi:hypothetical protein
MKDNVSVILERIQGNSLLYCVYTLNLRYSQDDGLSLSDGTTLLVRDQKSRNGIYQNT